MQPSEEEIQAELAALLAKSDERYIMRKAQRLVQAAEVFGLVVTIETAPLQPLAMGNYRTLIAVRKRREQS